MRRAISLDGIWQFSHNGGAPRSAIVPNPWQAQFADLRHSFGRGVYTRNFARPDLAGQIAVLRFGAVSDIARVTLNGVFLGEHMGGYLPFEYVLDANILRDTNVLEVEAYLPSGADDAPNFAQIPHGKQSWYGPLGGIWQPVSIELRPPLHMVHCAITADISGRVSADVTLSGAGIAALAVLDMQGNVVAETADAGQPMQVQSPALWSPDAPNLYQLRVTVGADVTLHSFGFRSFEQRDGQFYLNGAPWFMRAALDQDYYPEGICTPPSTAFLEDQLHKAKALGLNMLRCHIKVPDPRYYEVADRLGMLIWTEIPNVGQFSTDAAAQMRSLMEGILARDGNHASIVIWTLINEDWGTRLCEDPAHRRWLAQEYDWLKQRDPSRLVVDNSPCHGNFHVKSDINDFHYYRSVPERRSEWDALTAEFAGGADWTYSPFGDGQRRGGEPLVVSEFGVWGLPHPDQVQLQGSEPWWMETGGTWGDGVAYPHGIQNRFDALHLASVFGSFDQFIDAAQWYQFANLKYQIEVMRGYTAISGYVITEFTDVHWESNGLLDMNRNPRVFHDRFADVNADVVIVPRIDHYAVWAGNALRFDLAISTGGTAISGAVLHWHSSEGAAGQIDVAAVAAHSVAEIGAVALTPKQGGHRIVTIHMALEMAGGMIAKNTVEIAVYGVLDAGALPSVAVPDAAMAAYCTKLGIAVVPRDQADIILARNLDAGDIAAMQSGARYLLLAGDQTDNKGKIRSDSPRREQPFIQIVDDVLGQPGSIEGQVPNMVMTARHGSIWRGDWIAGFSWIRRAGVFADMPGGPMVDLSFDRVIPHYVLTGFRSWEYGGPVHAGVVVGWAHKPAAFIAERRVGRGAVVATTFRLMQGDAGVDPVAVYLLHALLQLTVTTAAEGP